MITHLSADLPAFAKQYAIVETMIKEAQDLWKEGKKDSAKSVLAQAKMKANVLSDAEIRQITMNTIAALEHKFNPQAPVTNPVVAEKIADEKKGRTGLIIGAIALIGGIFVIKKLLG